MNIVLKLQTNNLYWVPVLILLSHDVKFLRTEDFLLKHHSVLESCVTVSTTQCNKDTGDRGRLQSWSRGHLLIVRPCGHIHGTHFTSKVKCYICGGGV